MSTLDRPAAPRPVGRLSLARLLPLVALALGSLCGGGMAQEPPADSGLFITVQTPITSDESNRVREKIERAVRDLRVAKIIFDFNPDGKEASTDDFWACAGLADTLRQLHQQTTVAFVHNAVSRHTVLPVLACKELVMAPDATLGPVRPEAVSPPSEDHVVQYTRVAGRGREALVLKMLDPGLILMRGQRNGLWFFDNRARAEAVRDGVVSIDPQPLRPAGAVTSYTAEEAQRLGLCKLLAASRGEVREAYQLPPTSLREDPLEGRAPDAWKIDVRGPVTRSLEETLRRRIARATRRGANMIVLHMDGVSGGEYDVARDLADHFRTLRDPKGRPVVTVAFVPFEAPGTATFLAFGCTEIVMGEEAKLGNFGAALDPAPAPRAPAGRPARRPAPVDIGPIRDSLVQLAKVQGYSTVLARALFEPDLEVVRARSRKGAAVERRLLTKEDFEQDQQGERRWELEALVKAAGRTLELTAEEARNAGIARFVVHNPRDLNELYALYGIKPAKVQEPGPDWVEGLANFLSDPSVAIVLVIVGISCLILELKMPGVGIPGVIAALCFVLFFWSQSHMTGQVTWLAILLFLLGLALIAIEVFLIPGFGVVGVSGLALVLIGLGLATVDRVPQTSEEWVSFGRTMSTFGIGLAVAIALAFTVARYLPSIPYANRMVLTPPGERAEAADDALTASDEMVALLGAVGTAATMLRPAGMARIGEAYIDVVTEGAYVPAGARIQVVEIEGHRIVVKEV